MSQRSVLSVKTETSKPIFGLVLQRQSPRSLIPKALAVATRIWGWIRVKNDARTDASRLQVIDRVLMAEKNYLFIVQVDGRRFLVGGGQTALSLLTELKSAEPFSDVLKFTTKAGKPRGRKKTINKIVKPEVQQ
ncbi:hypothetical protein GOB94_01450 [Granulicella sp. 5B5]|uniref:flagellar biosynthetic protein FliO n=1 Tax=Granulicella sp. 5B5 TaxID=1617967 RepID=UPI0015F54BDC|nr:flagellar biosynthetic protein FliO [Granulicella sp. 5B5]QMV17519.1 hypothetical protein GOB94_01450 [Granulicella sp. 5B5]